MKLFPPLSVEKSHNTNIYIFKKSTSPAQRHPSTHRRLAHGLQDITATRATSKEKQALQVRLEVHINTGKSRESRVLQQVNG